MTHPACDACIRYSLECRYLEPSDQRETSEGGSKPPEGAASKGEETDATLHASSTGTPSSMEDAVAEPGTTRDNLDVGQKDSTTTSTSNTVALVHERDIGRGIGIPTTCACRKSRLRRKIRRRRGEVMCRLSIFIVFGSICISFIMFVFTRPPCERLGQS